jgi:hypothetical protein
MNMPSSKFAKLTKRKSAKGYKAVGKGKGGLDHYKLLNDAKMIQKAK